MKNPAAGLATGFNVIRSRRERLDQAFALGTLARQFAGAAHSLSPLTGLLLRGLLEVGARFHLTKKTLALHLLLQRAKGLLDIIVADDDLYDGQVSIRSGAGSGPLSVRFCCGGKSRSGAYIMVRRACLLQDWTE